jgi:hypothetical protein
MTTNSLAFSGDCKSLAVSVLHYQTSQLDVIC